MKLEVGMYVRTKWGIAKITAKHKSRIGNEFLLDKKIIDTHEDYYTNCMYDYRFYLEQIIKTSHNIIDLIEVGDYVNGLYIDQTPENPDYKLIWHLSTYGEDDEAFGEEDIKTIVTKEQFESMQYKVV